MLIELSILPLSLQEQILNIKQGESVQIVDKGKIIAKINQENKTLSQDSLTATAGLWKDCPVDGLAFQNQLRSEWDREWDK